VTHTPPEIWKDINQERTVKYDVYSFAVLLWELLSEQEPFKNGILHCCLLTCTLLKLHSLNKKAVVSQGNRAMPLQISIKVEQ